MNKNSLIVFLLLLSLFSCKKEESAVDFNLGYTSTNNGVIAAHKVISHTAKKVSAYIDLIVLPATNDITPSIDPLQPQNVRIGNWDVFSYFVDSVVQQPKIVFDSYENILLLDQSHRPENSANFLDYDIFETNDRISGILYYMEQAKGANSLSVYSSSLSAQTDSTFIHFITTPDSVSYLSQINELSFQLYGDNCILSALTTLVNSQSPTPVGSKKCITVLAHSNPITTNNSAIVNSIVQTAIAKGIAINIINFSVYNSSTCNEYLNIAHETSGLFYQAYYKQNYVSVCKNLNPILRGELASNRVYYRVSTPTVTFSSNFWMRTDMNFTNSNGEEFNYIPLLTQIP
jgi:hypothetical protein